MPEPKIINNTNLTLEQIEALPLVGRCRNEWRERDVTLHQHPTETEKVYSVGRTFDGRVIVICLEGKEGHPNTLAVYPRTYKYE